QRHFQGFAVIQFAHDDRNFGKPGQFGGAPAAFAADDFVLSLHFAGSDQDGLDDPLSFDTGGQRLQGGFVKLAARLHAGGNEGGDGEGGFRLQAAGLGVRGNGGGGGVIEQGAEAAAQAFGGRL